MDMKTLTILRLTLWGIVVSACAAIIVLYFATSQTLLNQTRLEAVAREGNVYKTIRDDMITPQLLALAKDSGYSSILDDDSVRSAVKKSFADDALETQLQPAMVSVGRWLNSQEEVPTFTIDITKPIGVFVNTTADELSARYMQLPECTYLNLYEDAQNGVCKTPGATPEQVREEVITTLQSQPLVRDAELSSEQIKLPQNVITSGQDLPQYISMLYAASIFAAGIGALVILRLLFKHRFYGVIAIGGSGILAALALLVISGYIRSVPQNIALSDTYQVIATSTVTAYTNAITGLLVPLAIGGILLVALGVVGVRYSTSRAKKAEVHVGRSAKEK
ncbi:MAG: hypothetical protein UY35_C0027G0010 [Candidatus Saccharibacteria bacterium GW2011_GWC2_48_9]|nr:MAG: hypothetical protein UY35_C0027G0010 [Candidatus Saccharibacteria bacterium GW2011_GWC2_48_9]